MKYVYTILLSIFFFTVKAQIICIDGQSKGPILSSIGLKSNNQDTTGTIIFLGSNHKLHLNIQWYGKQDISALNDTLILKSSLAFKLGNDSVLILKPVKSFSGVSRVSKTKFPYRWFLIQTDITEKEVADFATSKLISLTIITQENNSYQPFVFDEGTKADIQKAVNCFLSNVDKQ